MLLVRDIDFSTIGGLLAGYDLRLEQVAANLPIPGSYWGEPEAGIIGNTIFARDDTPVHSLLHEAAHLLVMEPSRRTLVHTNATDSIAEEDACCYLQIVLADRLPNVGSARIMADMDAWGYTFRLGSAHAWFEQDAGETRAWLIARGFLQ